MHVWCQSLESCPGGIQTLTQFVVRGLRELYPTAEIVVFAKNDLASGERTESKGQSADGKEQRPAAVPPSPGFGAPSMSQKSDIGLGGTESEGKDVDGEGAPRIVGFGGWPAPLRAAAFALSAVRHARSDQPDLIISTHVNLAPVARLAKKVAPTRFAVVGHGIEVWKIHKASIRGALQAADQLIAVSDFTRVRMAEELSVSKDRIELLPNTFDEDRFSPAPKSDALLLRYRLSKDQPIILTVARMEATEQYKGYENVLLAMPEVLLRFPEARYVIVGDGPDRPRIEALARRIGVGEKMVFAGYVPNEELAEHYNLCDVFAMPSKGEGFGIVFLEALGCGKPVIAGNKDASVETLLNGKLGLLVDPDSVEQIADAICAVLKEVSVQRAKSKEPRAEDRGRQFATANPSFGGSEKDKESITDNLGQSAESREQRARELRDEVIAAFGFEQFRKRLGEIFGKVEIRK